MISRRAALQLGVVAGGLGIAGFVAEQVGLLDDGLRAVGLRPHAEPDPRDVALLAEAAAEQAGLLAALDAFEGRDPPQAGGTPAAERAALRTVLKEQLAAVSDESSATPTSGPPADTVFAAFVEQVEAAAAARADGALAAGSLAVVKVLAAMSAGLEQVAVAARRLE